MNKTVSTRLSEKLSRTGEIPDVSDSEMADLNAEMVSILTGIAARSTFEDAKAELTELAVLHGLLATLLFKYSVEMTARQQKIIRMFDRWDDEDTLRYFYNEVRAGRV